MINGKFKNITISLLCILAVYQTGRLWFDDISGHSLFYFISSAQNRAYQSYGEEFDFTTPQNVVISFGNNNFNRFYIDKENMKLNDKIDECIKYMVQAGEYTVTKYIDWNEILSYKSVICYYGIDMPTDSYIKSFGGDSSQNFSNRQKYFNAIAIVPARTTGEYLKAYLINEFDNSCAVFSYKKNKFSDNLYAAIEEIQKQTNNVSYVSTYQSEFNMFKYNLFLPQKADSGIPYKPIKFVNPFWDNTSEKITFQEMETYTELFFENPSARWSDDGKDNDGIYTFSDENIVVRYYPSGVLEYANYSINVGNANNSFESAFNAASDLIVKDRNLQHENLYLSYAKNTENIWRFGFDYYYGDFPVVISDELKQKLNLEHIIEIEVEKGAVTNYRHYIYNMIPSLKDSYVSVDFSTVLNRIIGNNSLNSNGIENMYLSYVIDETSDYLDLKWIVDVDNSRYIENSVNQNN